MRGRGSDDAGFSLVEIIIAMLLLAVLALATLPLLFGIVATSTVNRTLVAASSLADARLASLREEFPRDGAHTCAQVRARAASDVESDGLVAELAVAECPGVYPGTVVVTVTVHAEGASASPLVTVPTRILVNGP